MLTLAKIRHCAAFLATLFAIVTSLPPDNRGSSSNGTVTAFTSLVNQTALTNKADHEEERRLISPLVRQLSVNPSAMGVDGYYNRYNQGVPNQNGMWGTNSGMASGIGGYGWDNNNIHNGGYQGSYTSGMGTGAYNNGMSGNGYNHGIGRGGNNYGVVTGGYNPGMGYGGYNIYGAGYNNGRDTSRYSSGVSGTDDNIHRGSAAGNANVMDTNRNSHTMTGGTNKPQPVWDGKCGKRQTQKVKSLPPFYKETPRMVGGNVASVKYWPWQVSLRFHEVHFCGGSVVSQRYILTAGHCFQHGKASQNPRDWTVFLGKSRINGKEKGEVGPIVVESITTHPSYGKDKRFDSDIALVRLSRPVNYTMNIQPICIPKADAVLEHGKECFVTGFGETDDTGGEGRLKQVMVPVIDTKQCSDMNTTFKNELTSNMFCAGFIKGDTKTCNGDSGGPLVCRATNGLQFIQQGVVSFGFGCAERNSPGIYAKVSQFTEWMKKVVSGHHRGRRSAAAVSTPHRPYFLNKMPTRYLRKFHRYANDFDIIVEEENPF